MKRSRKKILESSISEHDVDLYASNLEGIPIFPRTGADDDNVPPWHTRRLVRLVNEWSRNPHSLEYGLFVFTIFTSDFLFSISELAGKGHWFDGVLSDDETQKFLDRYLDREINPTLLKPPFPDAFTITTMNPFSTGSKGGIRILQAQVPFRLATLRVRRKGDQWIMDTTNVRRLGFVYDERQEGISSFSLDGKLFGIPPSNAGPSYLRNSMVDPWEAAPDLLWISKERHPGTYGPVIHVGPYCELIGTMSHSS